MGSEPDSQVDADGCSWWIFFKTWQGQSHLLSKLKKKKKKKKQKSTELKNEASSPELDAHFLMACSCHSDNK